MLVGGALQRLSQPRQMDSNVFRTRVCEGAVDGEVRSTTRLEDGIGGLAL